jgi:hypothetical protein
MAIKRFPRRIFRDSITLLVPSSFDSYQQPTNTNKMINNVHVQADNRTHKTGDNTEVQLKGRVWVYPPYSTPMYDLEALQAQTQALGGVLTCKITDKAGRTSGPYTILEVNAYPDDEDNLHHYELGLV